MVPTGPAENWVRGESSGLEIYSAALEFPEHGLPSGSPCRSPATPDLSARSRELPDGSVFLPARLPRQVQGFSLPTLLSSADLPP